MRVAFIKQALDLFGPWSTVQWADTSPDNLFNIWPGKASLWEMTVLFKADWYVLSTEVFTDYHRDLLAKQPEFRSIVDKYVGQTVHPNEIVWDQYDVVITFDPILPRVPRTKALLVYFMNEHWDHRYRRSLRKPIKGYDLFLAHMMDSAEVVHSLPQAVSYPYPRSPGAVKALAAIEKEEAVWVDWRTLTTLGMVDAWGPKAERAAERLQDTLGIPTRFSGDIYRSAYGVSDPPRWGDAKAYLRQLGGCKFYIAVGRTSGAGQGLCDALSAGCISFGERNKVYHRLACHPECLCEDMAELPSKFRKVVASSYLQVEILDWQEKALLEHFVEKPLAILEEAIALKRRG